MSAVLILFGEQNLDWQNAKKYMADGNKFKKMIHKQKVHCGFIS